MKIINDLTRSILRKPILVPFSAVFSPCYSGIGSIVMFHRVLQNDKEIICGDIEITEAYLVKIIDFFASKDYEFISLDDLYDILKGNIIKKKFVVFTFDDGYEDNYSVAYPVFKKYNIPFAIYICSSFPDKRANLWWYALKELTDTNIKLEFEYHKKFFTIRTSTLNEKKSAYREIRKLILDLNGMEQVVFIDNLFKKYDIKIEKYVDKFALSWNQIKTMSQDKLVTIGAHTENHYNLKELDTAIMLKEINKSKEKIEVMIGKKVEHFAYPFGSKNEASTREFNIAKSIGFKTSTTTRCGNIHLGHNKKLESLPRISPGPNSESPLPSLYVNGLVPALVNKLKRII
jgi:peptidoglycan/xylan/chitin deacetylase (PgdA/CDA1 family)